MVAQCTTWTLRWLKLFSNTATGQLQLALPLDAAHCDVAAVGCNKHDPASSTAPSQRMRPLLLPWIFVLRVPSTAAALQLSDMLSYSDEQQAPYFCDACARGQVLLQSAQCGTHLLALLWCS